MSKKHTYGKWVFLYLLFLSINQHAYSRSGSIHLNGMDIPLDQEIQEKKNSSERGHILVQFAQSLTAVERESYLAQGIFFERYLPPNTYLISAPVAALNQFAQENNILGMQSYSAIFKIDASLQTEIPVNSPGSYHSMSVEKKTVQVLFHAGTTFSKAMQVLLSHGASIPASQVGFTFRETIDRVTVPVQQLVSLAAEDSVYLISEMDTPIVPCNANAQDTSNVDEIHPRGVSGYDLDGTGVTVGLWDPSGTLTTHSQLIGRATQEDYGIPSYFHATHVAGTIGASGAGNMKAQGMAPNCSILCWDASNHTSEMDANASKIVASNHSYTTSVGWQYQSEDQQWHWYGNPRLSSWESHLFGRYGTLCQAFDLIVYEHDLMVVVSAGNNRKGVQTHAGTSYVLNEGPEMSTEPRSENGEVDEGYDTLNTIALGKNIITVGAIHDRLIEPPTPELDSIAPWSSWGPTDDGRIKPDLVANGIKLLSLDTDSPTATRPQSGTSMAAPVVTGSIACFVQQYRQRFNGATPSAAVMKSILLHTAQDEGTPPGPDYRIGWGLLDAHAAADFIAQIGEGGTYLEIDSFDGSLTDIQAEYIGEGPIKATLVWTDPAASPVLGSLDDNTTTLVNDLDLSLDGPDQLHYPWTLDPENPGDNAKQDRENHRDNIEQVFIAKPVEGPYTLHIGGQINLGDSQIYALCIRGLRIQERDSQLLILQPKGQRRTSGTVPVHCYATSKTGITDVEITLDGQILDISTTKKVDGLIHYATPQSAINEELQWDTTQIPNGEHLLAVRIKNASEQYFEKERPMFILNESDITPLHLGDPLLVGELSTTKDRDWYRIQVAESGVYTIETHAVPNYTAPDTELVLYGPNSQTQVIEENDDGGVERFSKITRTLQADKTYYVRVEQYMGSGVSSFNGIYGIDLIQTSQEEWLPEIVTIQVNDPEFSAQIEDMGDEHWYQFRTPRLGTYIMEASPTLSNPGNSFQFELFNKDDTTRPITQGDFSTPIFRVLGQDQEYWIRVSAPKATGGYVFSLQSLTELSPYHLPINGAAKSGQFTSGEMDEAWFILSTNTFTSYFFEFKTNSSILLESTQLLLFGPDDPAIKYAETQSKGGESINLFLPLRANHVYFMQILTEKGNGEYSIAVRTAKKVFPFSIPDESAMINSESDGLYSADFKSYEIIPITPVLDWILH